MTDQMKMDLKQGRGLRDEGMALAAMSRTELLAKAREIAFGIASRRGVVTIDDVRLEMKLPPGKTNSQNWIGSVFKTRDWEHTGQVYSSELPSNHARLIRVWRLAP